MKSSTGRWVAGDDFFDRERELQVLESRVRERNHVLLTGQRRMGKTSVARELGRRLEEDGWISVFADLEEAVSPEDAVAEIARAAHPAYVPKQRLLAGLARFFRERVEEVSLHNYRIKIRARLESTNWKHYGEKLLRGCAGLDRPVLLVLDELPMLLKQMLDQDGNPQRVDEFLRWMRKMAQILGERSPVFVVSGSIGLEHLVNRLRIPDRINHLFPFRLGPWDRETSIQCLEHLAESADLDIEAGVASEVYKTLGIGIPHHVQAFFACLRDSVRMKGRNRVALNDVSEVYRTELVGTSGQRGLSYYYEVRLQHALGDDPAYTIAMKILAEAAIQGVFTLEARHSLEDSYSKLQLENPVERIAEILQILEYDGYLAAGDDGHRFLSNLLKDWWRARFGDSHTPLAGRMPHVESQG